MRFKKLLLIYPHYPGSHYTGGRNTFPPVGLGIMGEMLTNCGADYEVVDLGLGYSQTYLRQRIAEYRPDALGISMMTFKYASLYGLLQDIKQHFPDVKIIAGGPHVTAWGTRVLEQCAAIDFGVTREGELTLMELCEGKECAQIKGLIYRNGEAIIANPERELIANLDSIPFPRYERFELAKYECAMQIMSSRGCPYQCIFCQSCSVLGKTWRSRSAGNIADEIQFWHDKGYRNFSFIDDNFTLNKQRIYDLCDELDQRQLSHLTFTAAGIRVDLIDESLLRRMKAAGFWYVAFGIEAGNNAILAHLKKGFTIERAHQIVAKAVELGFAVKLYFLVGSPYETLQDVQDSIDFARKYSISDVNFGSLMPIPETELIDWVKKEGRLLTAPEVYLNDYAEFERIPHFDAPGMTLKERKYAIRMTGNVRKKIQRQYRKRQLKEKLAHLGFLGALVAEIGSFEAVVRLINATFLESVKKGCKYVLLRDVHN